MINRNRQEKIEHEIADCVRCYSAAQATRKKLMVRVAELALSEQSIPEELRSELETADWELDYYPERLEELKAQYRQLIDAIHLYKE